MKSPMLTRAQVLVAVLALIATASIAAPRSSTKQPGKPVPPRCELKTNQVAASVHLNRSKAPPSVCVYGCDAKLVGVRKEGSRLAALAIYSGRRCLPAGSSKLLKKPKSVMPKPKAKAKPGITAKSAKPPAPARPAAVVRNATPPAAAKK